jgi:hypothetical protein
LYTEDELEEKDNSLLCAGCIEDREEEEDE